MIDVTAVDTKGGEVDTKEGEKILLELSVQTKSEN